MRAPLRWLYHVVRARELSWGADGRYAPSSLATEGFVHASFRDTVAESAKLYFAGERDDDLRVLAVDPRRLDVPVDVVETPRGPMPHVQGSVPLDAATVLGLDAVADRADRVVGARIALVAFEGMTLLDLVGPLDALTRIASMGFDPTARCEVVALTRHDDATVLDVPVWSGAGLTVTASRYRPALDEFDLVVVPGGPGVRALTRDAAVAAYLAAYPANRVMASVCTGALLLGAAGRLRRKRATTHARHLGDLEPYGAQAVSERVVDEGQLVTAGGVTAGVDLGLHLVLRLAGEEVARAIAAQMEVRGAVVSG